jgi:hypothetical protein
MFGLWRLRRTTPGRESEKISPATMKEKNKALLVERRNI